MNINIRTDEYFKNQYIKLCKSQGTNQTNLFIHIISRIIYHMTICNDPDAPLHIKQASKSFLYSAGIYHHRTDDVTQYNK